MKKIRNLLCVLMAAALTAGVFAGCGKVEKNDPVSSTTASGGTTAVVESTQKAPVPVKIFANWGTPEASEADKAWLEAVQQATNTVITVEVPPSSNYNERLNIMLAGGEYADVILFNDSTDKTFVDAVNNGIVIPITEYVDKAPSLKQYSYQMSWDALKVKGDKEIYGLPRTTIQRADGFIIRQDWLDNIGFAMPADNLITIDQFKEIMIKFAKNDPDKNGKADTYGWSASQDGQGYLYPILDYPFGNRGWQKADGEKYEYMDPQYSKENDAYKNALAFTAELFKEGGIDPNFATIKGDAAKARFKQGVTGAKGDFAGNIIEYQTDGEKINPNAKFTYISGVKDAEGKFARPSYGTGIWGCWGVTNKAKDPQAVISIFDWMLSDEGWSVAKYGVENVTYKNEGSNKVALPEFSNYKWGPAMVRRNNDPEFFVKINMQAEYREPVKNWIDTAIKGNITSLDYGFRPAASDKPEMIDYYKQLSEIRAKIILGAAPVSEWDKALDGWYKAGGEEYVQQMNDQIKKVMSQR